MHALIATLVISLLSVWSMVVSGQPSPQESPAVQTPTLTQDQIKQAQEALKTEGFDPGSVDGLVGAQTRRALRDYQAKAGLDETGALDEATFNRLAPRAPCEQVGLASWYGKAREGRQTAGGERFSAGALTAGHRTLPFETPVRVTNLKTGQSVEVTINDRGPKTQEHLIDLTQAAAERIGLKRLGEGQVRVEVLDPAACVAQQ